MATTEACTSADRAVQLQRTYYDATAHKYDALHIEEADPEHRMALQFMIATMKDLGVRSVLDIGCGTGRALLAIKAQMPDVAVFGIEPSEALRRVGYAKGLSPKELIDGDATRIASPDCSFDLVCAFGALHHIALPDKAVAEMLRVAKRAIFISDCNNFGQGSALSRTIKQALNAIRLWPLANFIKTHGRGFIVTEGDGLSYSYSVFNNYRQIAKACERIHLLNTTNAGLNPYRTATHVALLGLKSASGRSA